ncbi:hypothetical protein WJX82_005702 [Trebouxia sp. C0006]
MLSWIGDEDATNDEAQSAHTTAFYQEAVQNIPSIASCEDTDSDADVEEILFSGVNASDGSQPCRLVLSSHTMHPADHQQSFSIAGNLIHQSQHTAVGWFTGAAGQLAASRPGKANLAEQSNPLINTYAGMSSVTEEEVERAFQQAVHGSSVPEAVSPGVQLATAIHDTEIDRLLQKLVCGEVEYNPHDPSSGLPPASSLFTDSEASSEADDEKAAVSGHASAHRVPGSSEAAAMHSSKGTLQHQQAPGASATGRYALKLASESEKTQQRPPSQQVCVSNEQATSQTKSITGTYIRHRQTSRLANRFQRHDDYDADSVVAEEFDDWRSARAQLKSRSQK